VKRLNFVQGSAEWHAHRAQHFNASDAPAMLGCSPFKTRAQLLHEMHTGLAPEVDASTQRRFDEGHRFEALARPLAEDIIGEPLYPMVGAEGKLSASYDGLPMAEDVPFEHKRLNAELRAMLQGCDPELAGRTLPKLYRVQMEQQLHVCKGERVLFMATEWQGDQCVAMFHCWYYPDEELRAEILRGWEQFERDLAAYVPPAASTVVAEPVQALPAVTVQVAGTIAITDNFRAFEVALRDFLEHRLIRTPKTDQDFADLDVQIKAMKGAEAALDAAEGQMLAQIQTVDQAKKTKDMLAKLVRDNRLMAEKLLSSEKERRRGEIVAGGIGALKAHVDALNQRLGKPYMPATASAADFGTAIKGLKSLASMEDKVATTLANAKIAANEIADRIDANLKALREHAKDHAFLFADTGTLVLKAPEDCLAAITSRIAAHKAAEERRAAELAERERARIRAEEEARARAQAQREQQEREAAERRQQQETAALAEQERRSEEALRQALPAAAPPAANVLPMPTKAPAPATSAPTLRLGVINERIAPLSIDAAGLASLGFPHAATEKAAKLYHEADFPRICLALAQRLQAAARQQEAA
jgi:putative phage-type endonuclease